jgi:phage antirepressor YoqD-like protein
MQPKANYYDSILSSKDTMVITQIAKDYGLSGRKLNAILHEAHLIYKVNDEWVLYATHHDKGYTKSSTIKIEHNDGKVGTKVHMRWTQAGRLFIHEVLAKRGITPVSDCNDK